MSLLYLFVAIFAIYILVAPRFAAWLYRPILFPRLRMVSHENPPAIEQVDSKAVQFLQSDGNRLCAWYYRQPNSRDTVLVSHGNFGNMQTHSYLTEALVQAGYSVFIYDYSGYGASTGLPDLGTVTNDAEAAYDYLLKSEKLKPENIVLYGESIGASISAYLATIRECKAIICQSGFCSFRKIATEKMPLLRIYPESLFPRHCLDTMTSFLKIRIPTLIIHGMRDTVVPFHHARTIFESASHPKVLVPFPECDHRNITFANRDKFINTIDKFLQPLGKEKIGEQNKVV